MRVLHSGGTEVHIYMCRSSLPCSSFTDLLQLESGAALLKLLIFKRVAVGGPDWSLILDAADTFV